MARGKIRSETKEGGLAVRPSASSFDAKGQTLLGT
jgi:hypothetical protein